MVAGSVHPEYRQILSTFLAHLGPKLVTVPATAGQVSAAVDRAGRHGPDRRRRRAVPQLLRPARGCAGDRRGGACQGALAIVSVDPISLGLLNRPADYGADIVVAEGQSLGNPLRTAVPTWASWRAARSMSGRCRGGSSARRPTATASGAGCSRSRPASSTSGARRRPGTSAPTRACWRCEPASISP